jgi:hypothetical protein
MFTGNRAVEQSTTELPDARPELLKGGSRFQRREISLFIHRACRDSVN